MKSSFLIVTDRGNFKAYRVEKAPEGRPPRVTLVQAFSMTDAHLKITDRDTDMAGRFSDGSALTHSQGRQQNSTAERHLDLETDRRLIREIAGHVTEVLEQHQPEAWSFAAPSTIHEAVLKQLDGKLLRHLGEQVTADLVKIEPAKLLSHFSEVRAA